MNGERNAGHAENDGNVIFRGMLLNIPGNVLKHSGEFRQTFQGMSSNMRETQRIGGMLDSGECRQIIWGMSSNIPGNVAKHSRRCGQFLV